jgi:hypothetical protein
MVRGAGTITLAAGGLPVLAAWVVALSGLAVAHRPITDVLAEVLAVLLLVLGWRFRRGRLVVAAVALALANFLVRGPLADSPSEAGLAALAILLPITLAVLSLLPERPINRPLILALLGVVVIQAGLVAAIDDGQSSIHWSSSLPARSSPSRTRLVTAPSKVLCCGSRWLRPSPSSR